MEKRNYQRANINVDVYVNYDAMNHRGNVINLSLKGALIDTFENLDIKVDKKVKVRLVITDNSSEYEINIDGVVIRKNEYSMGVKFINIDLDSFINLRNIVAYNNGDYDKIMEEFINNGN